MTESLQQCADPSPDRRHLLARRQRFGILPTWWFWNDRKNWRLVGWGFGVLAVITHWVLSLFNLRPIVGGAIAMGVMVLAIGALEKYVRHEAHRRRELTSKHELPLD